MTGVHPSWKSQKGAAVAMAAEQLPCSPWEGFSKEAFRNSDLWEPRMRQRMQLVSRPYKFPVLELLPLGIRGLQPARVLRMTPTAVEPRSQSCRGRRDPPCRTSLGPPPPAVPA